MRICLAKDRHNSMHMMTSPHVIVRSLSRTVKGVGHRHYMVNFVSSPDLFDNLHTSSINCCGPVRQNCEGIPGGFDSKMLKLK